LNDINADLKEQW